MGLVSGTLRGAMTTGIVNTFFSSPEPSDLHLAILHSNEREALRLIRTGLKFPLIENGSSNLVLAIKNLPNIELVKELIDLTDQTTIDKIDKTTSNALMAAVEEGRLDFVQLLLEKGANPNIPDVQLNTPLSLTLSGQMWRQETEEVTLSMLRILVEKGAEVDPIDSEEQTPMQCHINDDDQEIYPRVISFLVERGADVTRAIRTKESTQELTARIANALQEGLRVRQAEAERALITNLPVTNLVQLVLHYV